MTWHAVDADAVLASPLIYLLIGAAVIAGLLGEVSDAVVILVVVASRS